MAAMHQSWFKNWPLDVPKNINYPSVPLQRLLEKAALDFPDKAAIAFLDKDISYRQLNHFCNQFANALNEMGIQNGDRVAIYLPNTPQFIIAFFGALKAGNSVTAISPLYREREVEYQLTDSGAKTIVALDSLYPIVEAVKRKTQLKNIIATRLDEFSSESPTPLSTSNVLSLKNLLESSSQSQPNLQLKPDEDLAAIQYTGGTTGTAKGAMLTHRNLLSNALAFAAWIRGTPNDVFLTALPLFHIYGMTTSMTVPISLGAKMVLMPKFDPAKVLETSQRQKITVFCGVPTMYTVLLANPELSKYDLTSIRVCISGASPLPPQVQKRFMEVTGGFLAEGYGLTEASPVTHCNPVDKTMTTVKVGSIGLPIPDTEAKIVDLETGTKTLPVGETGELAVKGPQVMLGYWQKPEENDIVLRHGWLLTGDIGRIDSDGYFYVTDRKKDLIKYKDYSVYPREIEDVLYEHPAVKLCAVVGVPDPVVGEVPKAFVMLKADLSPTEKEIITFVNDKVAPYKAIRMLEFRKELPVSGAGKVLRRKLKEQT